MIIYILLICLGTGNACSMRGHFETKVYTNEKECLSRERQIREISGMIAFCLKQEKQS